MGVPASLRGSRLLKGIGGVAAALVKKERLIMSLLERTEREKRKEQKTFEVDRDHENILGFQI